MDDLSISSVKRRNIKIYLVLLTLGLMVTASFFVGLQSSNYAPLIFFWAFCVNWGCTAALFYLLSNLTEKEKQSYWRPLFTFAITAIGVFTLGYLTEGGGYLFFPIFYVSIVFFVVNYYRGMKALFKSKGKSTT